MKALLFKAIFVLSLIYFVSCSEQGFIKQEKSSKGEANPVASEASEKEDSLTVNQPVMVGGAFLVCAEDVTLSFNETDSGLGCRVDLGQGRAR